MFNRNVKLQFNKMKYTNLVNKEFIYTGQNEYLANILKSRYFGFAIGVFSAYSLLNYDVVGYKVTRGLARWKNRVVNLIGLNDGHHGGHSEDNHGKHDNHDKHDKHDDHSKKEHH